MHESRSLPSYWLIFRSETSRMEVLTVRANGHGETLPVFSFEEEARTFLQYGASGTDWLARPISTGELISVLFGPYAGVQRIALDPLPGTEMPLDLVCVRREDFVKHLCRKVKSGCRAADTKGKTAFETSRSSSRSLARA